MELDLIKTWFNFFFKWCYFDWIIFNIKKYIFFYVTFKCIYPNLGWKQAFALEIIVNDDSKRGVYLRDQYIS